MSTVRKSSNLDEIHVYNKEYWWAKTPQQRLTAALKLIRRAKAIYYANPKNPPLGNGGHIIKSSTPIDYRKLPIIYGQDLRDLENLPRQEDV